MFWNRNWEKAPQTRSSGLPSRLETVPIPRLMPPDALRYVLSGVNQATNPSVRANHPKAISYHPIQRISVVGLGKLGSCIAATFAERGFDVLVVDIDAEEVRRINDGLPPVEEPLLEIIHEATVAALCER
jgi:hypothetical protein